MPAGLEDDVMMARRKRGDRLFYHASASLPASMRVRRALRRNRALCRLTGHYGAG